MTHPGVRFKGMLLTLKLVEWSLAEEIPKFLEKIHSWGYLVVLAYQLHHKSAGNLRGGGEVSGETLIVLSIDALVAGDSISIQE